MGGDYTAEIKLEQTLTIEKQGEGLFPSNFATGKIAPQNPDAGLVLKGVRMDVVSGQVGSTTFKSALRVQDGATLNFGLLSPARLGMDLVIGTADGGTTKGTVELYNTFAVEQHLTVYNDANITVYRDSAFILRGTGNNAWLLDEGPTSGYIRVEGILERRGTDETKIGLPVFVAPDGKLGIDPQQGSTTLTITSNGVAGTNNKSLYVDCGGEVKLNYVPPAGQENRVVTLAVNDDAVFDCGFLSVGKVNNVYFYVNTVEFKEGAVLDMVSNGYTNLFFSLTGGDAKVLLTSATWYFEVQGGGSSRDKVVVSGGNLEINQANTALSVTTLGAGVAGEVYYIIEVQFGAIIGEFADRPAAFATEQIGTPGGEVYKLTRSQFAGCVMDFSSEFNASPGDYSAAQALGAPDVLAYGDNPKAWSSASFNGTQEYLTVCFENPVYARGVTIRETYGNGFVTQVDLIDVNGNPYTIWTGTDPTQPGSPSDFTLDFPTGNYLTKAVKIYVNTDHNANTWEQIDAVILHGDAEGGGGGLAPLSGGPSLAGALGSIRVSSLARPYTGPVATFGVVGPVALGAPVTFVFSNPSGGSGFRYSFDFNNDGDFADSGERSDGTSPSATYTFTTRGWHVVRGRIRAADGRFTDVWVRVFLP